MNWKEIKKEYPKAFDLWENYSWWFQYWDEQAHHIEGIGVEHNDNRCLYDFFDEQKIRVYVTWTINKWFVWIGSDHQMITGYDTRKEAEVVAFGKAFEILETQ